MSDFTRLRLIWEPRMLSISRIMLGLLFMEHGTAKVLDSNADKKVDTSQTGKWAGMLSYSGTPAPLAAATFIGSRM